MPYTITHSIIKETFIVLWMGSWYFIILYQLPTHSRYNAPYIYILGCHIKCFVSNFIFIMITDEVITFSVQRNNNLLAKRFPLKRCPL